jgi:Flp pilus assembly protein TadD
MRIDAAYLIRSIVLACCAIALASCQNPAASPQSATGLASGDVAKNQQLAREQTDQAYALIEQSQFDRAEALLKKAVVADPLYGPAQNDLGLIYYHRDDLYNAAWEFENASKLMPRQAPPVNNLGLVLEKANKLSDAEKSYTSALDLDADNTEYAGNLARVRIRLGKRDDATRKLLDLIVMKDHRPEWVAWAREQASRISSGP